MDKETEKRMKALERVKAMAEGKEEIKKSVIRHAWHDDHILCVRAEVNEVEMNFWWVGEDGYAALEYAEESEKAKRAVREMMKDLLTLEEE